MSDAYREHRIRTSLQPHLGASPTEPAEIERLVRRARDELGVLVFRRQDLERASAFERAVVEGVHRRICKRSR